MVEMERKTDCIFRMKATKFDYSQGGCKHTDMDGFICLAFASEREAVWMVGLPNGCRCEMYTNKDSMLERMYGGMQENTDDAEEYAKSITGSTGGITKSPTHTGK